MPAPTILAYAITLAAMIAYGLHESGGRFTYPLDDIYIHMAIARTLAEHGVWGLDAGEFVSGSSSMAWTLLLATWFKLGGGELGPLLLNIPLSLAILFACDRIARSYGLSERARLFTLLLIALVTPLPLLTLMGMEHCLQALVFILFLVSAARYLENGERTVLMLVLLALMTAIRPEGMFAAAVFIPVLLFRKGLIPALVAGLVAAAPILVFGVYLLWNGAYPLPNSILLKAGLVDPNGGTFALTLVKAVPKLLSSGVIVAAITTAIAVLRSQARDARWYFALLWLGTAFFHVLLSPFGWLFRYEAYLVTSGILVIALNLPLISKLNASLSDRRALRLAVYLVVAVILAGTVNRAVAANWAGAAAMRDRLYENVASAEFVKRYFDDEAVMVNDIGTFAYLTDAKVLDLFGLGSNEPIAFQRTGDGYNSADVERWAQSSGARLMIIKHEWLQMRGLVPPGWRQVATWYLPRNVVFTDFELAFYARDEASAEEIARDMREFSRTLPPGIRMRYGSRMPGKGAE